MLSVLFLGVRGSAPAACEQALRYGGNTSCVVLRDVVGDALGPPLILDMGTGLIALGDLLVAEGATRATVLLSHLHWDHIQGFPFFQTLDQEGANLDVWSPDSYPDAGQLLTSFASPPHFPVHLDMRPAQVHFKTMMRHMEFAEPSCRVTALEVSHTDPVMGFRIETERSVVAYVTDHQALHVDGEITGILSENVRELCRGADLLIHDAQYTDVEFKEKATWGHSTYAFAVHVAKECGVRRLAFFHHDPRRSDDELDAIVAKYSGSIDGLGVIAAREGMDILLP